VWNCGGENINKRKRRGWLLVEVVYEEKGLI
jgi:hypothetical protein